MATTVRNGAPMTFTTGEDPAEPGSGRQRLLQTRDRWHARDVGHRPCNQHTTAISTGSASSRQCGRP